MNEQMEIRNAKAKAYTWQGVWHWVGSHEHERKLEKGEYGVRKWNGLTMGIWHSLPECEIMNELKGFLSWSLKMGLGEAIINWAIGIGSLIKLLRLIWKLKGNVFYMKITWKYYFEILGEQSKYEINMGG